MIRWVDQPNGIESQGEKLEFGVFLPAITDAEIGLVVKHLALDSPCVVIPQYYPYPRIGVLESGEYPRQQVNGE